MRQYFDMMTSGDACAGCHHGYVNPLGFAFEHFDAAGLYRETDNDLPIDAARELSELLASSADARRCFAKNWFAFSQGRDATDADACFLERLDEAFSNGVLRELLVELGRNDGFLYRAEAP